MGSVRDEIMRLFAEKKRYGLYAEVGRHVRVSGQAVSEWARGDTIPTETHWPELESYFELKPGHLARIARGRRAVVPVEPKVSDDRYDRLEQRLNRTDAMVEDLTRSVAELMRAVRGRGEGLNGAGNA